MMIAKNEYTRDMKLDVCKQKLNEIINQNPAYKDTFSVLTSKAWGSSKAECFDLMG